MRNMYLKSPLFVVICGQGASAEVQRCWSNLCSLSDGRHETSLVLNLQNHPKVTPRQIDFQHCLMPILTSPDWIVGVSMENLCLANGSWVDSRVVDLYPWDAGAENSLNSNSISLAQPGTNSGLGYHDHGNLTIPREAIHRWFEKSKIFDQQPYIRPPG